MVTAKMGKSEPSTGMAKIYQVIVGLIEEGRWSITRDHQKEAGLLNKLFSYADKGAASSDIDFNASKEKDVNPSISFQEAMRKKWPDFKGSFKKLLNFTPPENSPPSMHSKREIREKFLKFKELMSTQKWEEAELLLEDTIIFLNSDTGGQAEFVEMLAPLVLGPSLYLVYHRLTDKLDKEYPMWSTNEEGMDSEKEDSTITVEDFLFQALASIACFRNPDTDEASSEAVSEDTLKKYAKVSKKSKAIIVGTHRDEVSDEDLKERNELLGGKIKDTDFYDEDIVKFVSEGQPVLDVNNYDGGEEDRSRFRNVLRKVIDGSFAEVEIPASWLMLSLYVRMMGSRIMTLKELEALAEEIEISPKELQVALWFFHRIVGLFLYYPELEELKDVVICDVRVVFDSITELIKNTFVFDKVGQRAAEKFRNSAQFSRRDLEKATQMSTASATSEETLLPLEMLVKLLEHLNILTTLTVASEVSPSSSNVSLSLDSTYFMPSILRSVKTSELIVEPSPSDPASLMIRYKCGYVPPWGYFVA